MRYLICVIFAILTFYACSYGEEYIEEEPNIYKETLIIDNFMYESKADILSTYDISDPKTIKQIDEQRLNNQIESMVAFGGTKSRQNMDS
ncbi:MAG: hypothetical protein ACJA1A_002551 [Saprospiraceae bacterium]|jgi:hypothetical protein|tara:strand:+ start:131 stop:400 length:270 start_codon:yes stop_codon:yes gene_type:complete